MAPIRERQPLVQLMPKGILDWRPEIPNAGDTETSSVPPSVSSLWSLSWFLSREERSSAQDPPELGEIRLFDVRNERTSLIEYGGKIHVVSKANGNSCTGEEVHQLKDSTGNVVAEAKCDQSKKHAELIMTIDDKLKLDDYHIYAYDQQSTDTFSLNYRTGSPKEFASMMPECKEFEIFALKKGENKPGCMKLKPYMCFTVPRADTTMYCPSDQPSLCHALSVLSPIWPEIAINGPHSADDSCPPGSSIFLTGRDKPLKFDELVRLHGKSHVQNVIKIQMNNRHPDVQNKKVTGTLTAGQTVVEKTVENWNWNTEFSFDTTEFGVGGWLVNMDLSYDSNGKKHIISKAKFLNLPELKVVLKKEFDGPVTRLTCEVDGESLPERTFLICTWSKDGKVVHSGSCTYETEDSGEHTCEARIAWCDHRQCFQGDQTAKGSIFVNGKSGTLPPNGGWSSWASFGLPDGTKHSLVQVPLPKDNTTPWWHWALPSGLAGGLLLFIVVVVWLKIRSRPRHIPSHKTISSRKKKRITVKNTGPGSLPMKYFGLLTKDDDVSVIYVGYILNGFKRNAYQEEKSEEESKRTTVEESLKETLQKLNQLKQEDVYSLVQDAVAFVAKAFANNPDFRIVEKCALDVDVYTNNVVTVRYFDVKKDGTSVEIKHRLDANKFSDFFMNKLILGMAPTKLQAFMNFFSWFCELAGTIVWFGDDASFQEVFMPTTQGYLTHWAMDKEANNCGSFTTRTKNYARKKEWGEDVYVYDIEVDYEFHGTIMITENGQEEAKEQYFNVTRRWTVWRIGKSNDLKLAEIIECIAKSQSEKEEVPLASVVFVCPDGKGQSAIGLSMYLALQQWHLMGMVDVPDIFGYVVKHRKDAFQNLNVADMGVMVEALKKMCTKSTANTDKDPDPYVPDTLAVNKTVLVFNVPKRAQSGDRRRDKSTDPSISLDKSPTAKQEMKSEASKSKMAASKTSKKPDQKMESVASKSKMASPETSKKSADQKMESEASKSKMATSGTSKKPDQKKGIASDQRPSTSGVKSKQGAQSSKKKQ